MKLVLGVNQASYSDPSGISGEEMATVGEVAKAIEKKYGLMGKYVEMNAEAIGDAVAEQLVAKMEGQNIFGKELKKISTPFKDDLQLKLFDGKIPGVPTKAGNLGRKWRRNSPNRGPNRPSFIDTGTYKAAMTAVLKDA